jgi:hypothetical protein
VEVAVEVAENITVYPINIGIKIKKNSTLPKRYVVTIILPLFLSASLSVLNSSKYCCQQILLYSRK